MSDPDPLDEFPTRFPIFPLPNVVLFPGTYLPLHIFEPRYRQMTEAALAGDAVIGMVLLRADVDPMAARAPIFAVGCAGRIVEHRRLDDGRFHLLLYGERRFRIARELESGALYRDGRSRAASRPGVRGTATERSARARSEPRSSSRRACSSSFGSRRPTASRRSRERMRALDPLLLTSAIAFGLDGPMLEKQSLLESARSARARRAPAARARVPNRRSAASRRAEDAELIFREKLRSAAISPRRVESVKHRSVSLRCVNACAWRCERAAARTARAREEQRESHHLPTVGDFPRERAQSARV